MAIYGIGCYYDGKDVGNDFYAKGVACIGWPLDAKPYLSGIMKEIDIGDIIIIKSFFQRGGKQVLRIRGVGIVADNALKRVRSLGHCIEVKWLKYDATYIIELEFTKEDLMPAFNGERLFTRNITRSCVSRLCNWQLQSDN